MPEEVAYTFQKIEYNVSALENQTSSFAQSLAQVSAWKPISGKIMTIVVMPSSRSGWSVVSNERGIIAILIGLLLPAGQKSLSLTSGEVAQAKGLLASGGRFGIHQGTSFVFHNITWT